MRGISGDMLWYHRGVPGGWTDGGVNWTLFQWRDVEKLYVVIAEQVISTKNNPSFFLKVQNCRSL